MFSAWCGGVEPHLKWLMEDLCHFLAWCCSPKEDLKKNNDGSCKGSKPGAKWKPETPSKHGQPSISGKKRLSWFVLYMYLVYSMHNICVYIYINRCNAYIWLHIRIKRAKDPSIEIPFTRGPIWHRWSESIFGWSPLVIKRGSSMVVGNSPFLTEVLMGIP